MSGRTNIKTPSDEIWILINRSELYGMLALLYRHPSLIKADFLDSRQKAGWKEAAGEVSSPNNALLATSLDFLTRELDGMPVSRWISLYEDCFSHTAHGTVSSYELEYGEEHSHRQPQQLGDIAAFYRAFGLKINEKSHERADHVSAECEFMHFLCFKEAYALEHDGKDKADICRQAACRFLSEHLGQWVPSFALRLSKYAKEGFFKQLADFTLAFITQDCQMCGVVPGPGDLPIRSVTEKIDAGCVSCSLKADFQC